MKNDAIINNSNVLLLSETRMKNGVPIDIPNLNFVVSYKRTQFEVVGVAVYHNKLDTSYIVSLYMDIHAKFTSGIGVIVSDIGKICVTRFHSENGQYILMIPVYISPGKSIRQIHEFLFENLMIYTKEGSQIPIKRFGDVPMILNGNLNINITDYLPIIEFFNKPLALTMSNDRKLQPCEI